MTLSKTPTGHPAGNALRPLNDCPPPASRGAPGDFFPTRRQASKSRRFTCHGPIRAQNGFEKSKKSLAFSTGSTQAGAMSAPLRPRPARALRCNFRRFESASTKKDRESRATELRTPPSMNRQARPKKAFGTRNPAKQRQRPLITFREISQAPRQSDKPTWIHGRGPIAPNGSKTPNDRPAKTSGKGGASATLRPLARQTAAHRSKSDDARSSRQAPPPCTTHRPGKGEFPAPRFQIAAPSPKASNDSTEKPRAQ